MSNKLFISTTLPYLNSHPHCGHLFEFVLADIYVRFLKQTRPDTSIIFNVGTDEHGQKIYQVAQREGIDTQEYCDQMSNKWFDFCKKFKIDYTNFYRTTNIEHKKKATEYFEKIRKNNYLYLKKYSGLYCDGCEAFKTEKEIINEKCIDHVTLKLKYVEEENYFLKLKELTQQIHKESIFDNILFENTLQNELNNFVGNAEDISVSRENVDWAIPIPSTNQTIYIWNEALMNYVFAAGYVPGEPLTEDFKDYWQNSLIICGPDNLRFQALILPALLQAGGLPVTHHVMVHGSILDEEGKKMSKTTGNVVDPIEQLDKYGVDPVRYYLAAGLNTYGSSKYSEKELVQKWNNDIVNGYGNLMARVLHLIDLKKIEIKEWEHHKIPSDVFLLLNGAEDKFRAGDISSAYTKINKLVIWANTYISNERPFDKNCKNPGEILNLLYHTLLNISVYYKFVFPDRADEIDFALQNKKLVILFKPLETTDALVH